MKTTIQPKGEMYRLSDIESYTNKKMKNVKQANPYYGNMSIKIPYLRKDISALLALSAAIVLLLATSPLLLFNPLQPVQAQTSMTFRTTQPAKGRDWHPDFSLTFDVQGSPNDNQSARITSGTVQMTRNPNGTLVCSGYIGGGQFTNNSMALVMDGAFDGGPSCTGTPQYIELKTSCSTSNTNVISLNDDNGIEIGTFSGPVECSKKDTTDTTTQQQQQQSSPPSSSSSPMTASSQDRDSSNRSSSSDSNTNRDGDGDGVPDSSDRCLHTSNPRCFKEAT